MTEESRIATEHDLGSERFRDATKTQKSGMFEWLRKVALEGGQDWFKAGLAMYEIGRLHEEIKRLSVPSASEAITVEVFRSGDNRVFANVNQGGRQLAHLKAGESFSLPSATAPITDQEIRGIARSEYVRCDGDGNLKHRMTEDVCVATVREVLRRLTASETALVKPGSGYQRNGCDYTVEDCGCSDPDWCPDQNRCKRVTADSKAKNG